MYFEAEQIKQCIIQHVTIGWSKKGKHCSRVSAEIGLLDVVEVVGAETTLARRHRIERSAGLR